jgi:hypothetical protein
MGGKIVIVARQHAELHDYLRRRFTPASGVEVILDRRLEERRAATGSVRSRTVARERRRGERRSRPEVDELLCYRSHVIVTIPERDARAHDSMVP